MGNLRNITNKLMWYARHTNFSIWLIENGICVQRHQDVAYQHLYQVYDIHEMNKDDFISFFKIIRQIDMTTSFDDALSKIDEICSISNGRWSLGFQCGRKR